MTPDVVVDVGNSRVKWGRVVGDRVAETAAFAPGDADGWDRTFAAWKVPTGGDWAVASVNPAAAAGLLDWLAARAVPGFVMDLRPGWLVANSDELGFTIDVEFPVLVGIDRLLAALAARRRTPADRASITISVGTAMTVDYTDPAGRFVGGAILPGPRLMAKSLHEYTAKLPEIAIDPVPPVPAPGRNTEEAIERGVAAAVLGAADHLIRTWATRSPTPPRVFVTGGDGGYFRRFAFTSPVESVVHDPALTLDGVRVAAGALP